MGRRTDLALEAQELWREGAAETTRLPGVRARTERWEGQSVTRVEILDPRGAEALGKPAGTYLTLDLAYWRREEGFFPRAVEGLGQLLRDLLPEEGSVLVVGLGNAAMTADAFAEDVQGCMAAGMNAHISKPIQIDKVLSTIRFLVSRPKH